MIAKSLRDFVRSPLHDKCNTLSIALARLKTATYYRYVCASIGLGSRIDPPLLLVNPRYLSIGSHSMIRRGARIEIIVRDPQRPPSIQIGSNVNIEQNVHIVCSSGITIGDGVSITANCGIVDTSHPYDENNPDTKTGDRINSTHTPVEIGDYTFIGMGSVILPGVRIGKSCVIGANSTVTRDIPDYSIAAGSPAVVIRQLHKIKK